MTIWTAQEEPVRLEELNDLGINVFPISHLLNRTIKNDTLSSNKTTTTPTTKWNIFSPDGMTRDRYGLSEILHSIRKKAIAFDAKDYQVIDIRGYLGVSAGVIGLVTQKSSNCIQSNSSTFSENDHMARSFRECIRRFMMMADDE
jgi:hypothetical protein